VFARHKYYGIKRYGNSGIKAGNSGFSLLEVLIASTVFCLGMAGFAALLLGSLIGSAEARRESVASLAAASLAEQIRLNPVALDRYLNPPEVISRICADNGQCTPEQQADYDFRLWQLELADSIRNARGLVCHDETPEDQDILDRPGYRKRNKPAPVYAGDILTCPLSQAIAASR